jgi:ABC-type amino acid transport substrate-binding protein
MKCIRWAALLVVIVLAGCGDDEGGEAAATATPAADVQKFESGTPLGDIQQKGEIVIGVKYDVPPFGFNNPSSGKIEGFDVDLGQAVADKLGVKPKFIEAISDNRIPFLQDGTADVILSRSGPARSSSRTRTSSPRAASSSRRTTRRSPASSRWPARTSAPRSARPTRRRSRSRPRRPSSSSSTPTRSASSRSRTGASTRSRPTT